MCFWWRLMLLVLTSHLSGTRTPVVWISAVCRTSPAAPLLTHRTLQSLTIPPVSQPLSIFNICTSYFPSPKIPFLQQLLVTKHHWGAEWIPGPSHLLPSVICAPATVGAYYANVILYIWTHSLYLSIYLSIYLYLYIH